MATTASEDFELADATALDEATTNFDAKVGAGTLEADTADPLVGTASARCVVAGDNASLRHNIGSTVSSRWWRWYHTPDSLPGGNTTIASVGTDVDGLVGEVRQLADGRLQVRNGQVADGNSTVTLSAGDEVRLGWQTNDTTGTNELLIFTGANVHGDTPNDTISSTNFAGTFSLFFLGSVTSDTWEHHFDAFAADDAAYPGSAVTPDVQARIHEARFVIPQAALATARIHEARLVLPASSAGATQDGSIWAVSGGTLHPVRVYKARDGGLVQF